MLLMDLSDFTQSGFDPKEWINRTLSQQDRDASESVTLVATKLQMYFHQVNGEFESTAQNVLQNLPRVIKETEMLYEETQLLRDKMNSVKKEIGKVETDSMASLERMDNIKMELVKAEQALHEAGNWTILIADVEKLLDSDDVDAIAAKLVSMQQSLSVLSNIPDIEDKGGERRRKEDKEKEQQLEGFKNILEARVIPLLVQAFTTKSSEQSKRLVNTFQAIGRLPQFLNYYTQCQKDMLVKSWDEIINTDSEDILETLKTFYGNLILNWQDQIKWCEYVIPHLSISDTLCEVYSDLLTILSPKIQKQMDNNLKKLSEPLVLLCQLRMCSKQFTMNIKPFLENGKVKQKNILQFAKAVYLPYLSHADKYGTYQAASFHQFLSKLDFKREVITDSVQNLGELNSSVLSCITDGVATCQQLTEGCSIFGFVDAAKWLLSAYIDQYRIVTREIYSQNKCDFNIFQMCSTLLKNIGSLLDGVEQVNDDVMSHVRAVQSSMEKRDVHPLSQFHKLLLTPASEKEFLSRLDHLQGMAVPSAVGSISQDIKTLCQEVYQSTFEAIFAPISGLLEGMHNAPAWKDKGSGAEDLPDYSLTPQEYITQVGDHLLRLPQLLDPFTAAHSPALALALASIASHRVQMLGGAPEETSFTDVFLGKVAKATCQAYCEEILKIHRLSTMACKQLATDINYLGNVFEMLEFSLTEQLEHIVALLKLPPSEYGSRPSGIPPRLVAAIRQIRNIISE